MTPTATRDLEVPHQTVKPSFKSVSEVLTDDLRAMILSGELAEGEPLPQRSVARRYGVSEVVVREALRVLEHEGMVATEPRKGARVSCLSAEEVREIWELRLPIERLLTEKAVPAARAEDLAQAEALNKAMTAARDPVAWLSLNREFHTRLYTPAQRPRILRFADNLRMMMDRYLRLHLGVLQRFDVADREHRDILTAYHERDSHLACKYVEAHLLRTADSVVTFLAKRGK